MSVNQPHKEGPMAIGNESNGDHFVSPQKSSGLASLSPECKFVKVVTAEEKKRDSASAIAPGTSPGLAPVTKVLGFGSNIGGAGESAVVMPAKWSAVNSAAISASKKERKFYEMLKVAKAEHSTNPHFNQLTTVNRRLYNWLNVASKVVRQHDSFLQESLLNTDSDWDSMCVAKYNRVLTSEKIALVRPFLEVFETQRNNRKRLALARSAAREARRFMPLDEDVALATHMGFDLKVETKQVCSNAGNQALYNAMLWEVNKKIGSYDRALSKEAVKELRFAAENWLRAARSIRKLDHCVPNSAWAKQNIRGFGVVIGRKLDEEYANVFVSL